jgi:hypothetical protein
MKKNIGYGNHSVMDKYDKAFPRRGRWRGAPDEVLYLAYRSFVMILSADILSGHACFNCAFYYIVLLLIDNIYCGGLYGW